MIKCCTYPVTCLCLLLLPVLLLPACVADDDVATPAPPLVGFGDQTGIVDVRGGVSEATVYLTRAPSQDQGLEFDLEGDALGGEDIEVITPSPIIVPAGATEIAIQLRVAPGPTPTQPGRRGVITLRPGGWYRLSERDTFAFNVNLPHTVGLEVWADGSAFPQLYGYTSFSAEPVPSDGSPGEHFVLARSSTTEPNVIGVFNPQPGNSTNAFNMHRLYPDFDVTSASANIRIPSLFRLTPNSPGADFGTVEVIEQRVTITRRPSSGLPPFTVGISGGGTYDEASGIMDVEVSFDESELGVPEAVVRRYSYESERR